jgi:aconitate decarboxylase
MNNCSIEITMKNGQTFTARTSALRGSPANPLSLEECMQKFRKCVAYSPRKISEGKADEILNAIQNLENINDIKQFTGLLR